MNKKYLCKVSRHVYYQEILIFTSILSLGSSFFLFIFSYDGSLPTGIYVCFLITAVLCYMYNHHITLQKRDDNHSYTDLLNFMDYVSRDGFQPKFFPNSIYFHSIVAIYDNLSQIPDQELASTEKYKRDSIKYLKKMMKSQTGNYFIADEFLNKKYTHQVYEELNKQLMYKRFNASEFEKIPFDQSQSIEINKVTPDAVCNIILIFLAVAKIYFTIRQDLHAQYSQYVPYSLFYNTSIDLIAVAAVFTRSKKNE